VRGLRKPSLAARNAAPPRCAAMAVGSVPYVDPAEALRLILERTPEIPAWPQLPRRSYLENMYVQFTEGLPGMVVDEPGLRAYVQLDAAAEEIGPFLEKLDGGDPAAFAVSPSYAAALPMLGRALTSIEMPPPFVKGQITGPVSFGLSVPFEDRRAILYDDTFRDIATKLLSAKARWQADLLALWAPASVPLIMVDEPSLTQAGSAFVSIPEAIAFPALEECLGAIDCLTGIHVCGGTDWGRVIGLPLDVLNFDAADHLDSLLSHADAVAGFLTEGGMLAWGAVPNDERAFTLTAEVVGGRMIDAAGALARLAGSEVDTVLAASFVSPACGTGSLPVEVAERCFALAAETSCWLRARL
jgi:hypothetical protein